MNFKILVCLVLFVSPTSSAMTVGEHVRKTFSGEGAFDRTGIYFLIGGAALTTIAFKYDDVVQQKWKNNQVMSEGVADVGDFWGTGVPALAMNIGQYSFDDPAAVPTTEGLLATVAVTFAMKYAIGRPRPESTTKTSFPSGHTSMAFATATTAWKAYGWKWGLPAMVMAVWTGLSRIADNRHWLSDVVAGATVGIVMGRAGFGHHQTTGSLGINSQQPRAVATATWVF